MAQRSSRKRRKQRQRRAAERPAGAQSTPGAEAMSGGYARAREKDEQARAALEPLAEGERPGAVTVGAAAAVVLAAANLVSILVAYDPDEPNKTIASAFGVVVLAVVAVGMWRARYWAVLGMQTVLAITIVLGSVALLTASNAAAVALIVPIIVLAALLFWFLVKALARIQMPERPGARS